MRIDKKLMNFEEYPNDVQRGFNLWHVPVWYTTQALGSNE